MNAGEIITSIISGSSVLILAAIARGLLGMRKDFRRFMQEHLWLLATSMWTKDKVIHIMQELDMPVGNPPPNNLPRDYDAD